MPNKYYRLILFLYLFIGMQCQADTLFIDTEKSTQDSLTTIVKTNEVTTARAFSPRFKDTYSGEDFVYERKKDKKSLSLWERFLKWLNELFSLDNNPNDTEATAKWIALILKFVLYVLIVVAFVYILKMFLYKDGTWWFTKNPKNIDTHSNSIEIDINQVNFEQIISESIHTNNYRLAVRYYYLWLLKKLSDKNYIDWHPEKTNREYLYEIKFEKNRKDFSYASQIYEYTWYGMFDLQQYEFEAIKNKFQKMIQEL